MEVLFLILKIAGICLLVLLGLFLLLILSICFIPVRYRIRGKGRVPEAPEADTVFSWFFPVLHCRIRYGEEGVRFRVRIFGIPLRLGKKPQKEKRKAKEPKRKKDRTSKKSAEEQKAGVSETPGIRPETTEEKERIAETTDAEGSVAHRRTSETTEVSEKPVRSPKSGNIFRQKTDKLRQMLSKLKKKILQLKEQFCNIKSILSEETNRNALMALLRELKYVMKHFLPRKAKGEVQFGMEDPANTGQILGMISLLPFWYRYKISVTPDFTAEGFYARGDLSIKGHIRSVHLLISGIRLIKNKDIRKFINQISK